jgi:hypothetical protein
MARKNKFNLDYFPHIISSGKKISYIRKKYGNDGYATWFTILEELGLADFHYLDLRNEKDDDFSIQLMFLSERCYISEELLLNIISDLVKLGSFDKELWNNKILWSEEFFDSVQDAWRRRDTKCLTREELILKLTSSEIKIEKNKSEFEFEVKKNENKKIDIKSNLVPKKEKIEKEIVYPWESENFKNEWDNWKTFKNDEFKFRYKSKSSEQMALIDLSKLSKGNEEDAIKIIHNSIGKGWKGFFELKNSGNGKSNTKGSGNEQFTVSSDYASGILGTLLSE